MNLLEIFAQQVRARPQAAAIIESRDGKDISTPFQALALRSAKVAALLQNKGIRSGDPVLLLQPVSCDLYAVVLALFRLGAVAVFLDPSAGRQQIEQCCGLEPPRAFIACPKAHLLRLVCGALQRIPLKLVVGPSLPGATTLRQAQNLTPLADCEPCSADTPALLTFTSGSTGLPKATIRTHGFLRAQHQVLERHLKLTPGEVDLCTLPIFLLANLASGVTSVIPDADLRAPGSIAPEPVLAQINRLRVCRITASPAFFERLVSGGDVGRAPLQGLRKMYTGGAPVFPRLLGQLLQAAPQAEVEAVYGSTEAEPIAHLNARDIRPEDRAAIRKGNGLLAGAVIPEIQLRIIRDQWGKPIQPLTLADFKALECSTQEIGEIVVAGDHVVKGYLHDRGDNETKFTVAGRIWHRTGDAGKLDRENRLWLLGRCAAKVQDAHGSVYPLAVECVAAEHKSVHRAAFVSHAGKRLLVLEPVTTFTQAARREVEDSLAWAGLSELRVFPHLPVDKRHNAKIDYPTLIRMLEKLK